MTLSLFDLAFVGSLAGGNVFSPPWDGPYDGDEFLASLVGKTGQSFARTTSTFGNLVGNAKWGGGVLGPNGKIYCIPRTSTTVLEIGSGGLALPDDMTLSPYLNKL